MLDRARELLSRNGVLPVNGASDPEIGIAEGLLGRFPEDYRHFLKEYGWISLGHLEIYGLGSGIPHYLQVVRMTLLERSETGSPIPETIVFWDHEKGASQALEIAAPSFEDWLARLLESEL